MARKRVKLAFIVNDVARKTTYNKRKKGLLKKVYEISTLCGVEACAVIYGPYEPHPAVWPSPCEAKRVLSSFREKPEAIQTKQMANQETFMNQMVLKAKDKLAKLRKDNREKEMKLLFDQCLSAGKLVNNDMSVVDLNYLGWLIDHKLKDLGRRMESWDDCNNVQIQSQNMAIASQDQLQLVPLPPPTFTNEEITMLNHGHVEMPTNNADIIERQFSMNLKMNGDGDTTIPFGEVDPGVLPNLFP